MDQSKLLSWGQYHLKFGCRTQIMGILNVTPDSFSDGGQFDRLDKALAHVDQMIADGADIIDIGGESSRPFSDPVSIEDEIQRVVPVIEKIASKIEVPISIDTTKSEVAGKALDAGAAMINDISALRLDPRMGEVAAQYDVPVILMHMQGTPKTMQQNPVYKDLINDICSFLNDAVQGAVSAGISKSKIIIDPGLGFGKTFQHNLEILKNLSALKSIGVPILVGPSRKAFLRHILKIERNSDLDPLDPCVETGTQAAVAAAILNGANIVRVHNVKETTATVKIIDAVKNADSNTLE